MIVLFTDFGVEGPYTGQMTAVLLQSAPAVPIVSLFADLPPGRYSCASSIPVSAAIVAR